MNSPKKDCDQLLNQSIDFAQQMLTEHGEFIPFGGTMNHDGELIHVGTDLETEHPKSSDVIDVLVDSFREGAVLGKHRATAYGDVNHEEAYYNRTILAQFEKEIFEGYKLTGWSHMQSPYDYMSLHLSSDKPLDLEGSKEFLIAARVKILDILEKDTVMKKAIGDDGISVTLSLEYDGKPLNDAKALRSVYMYSNGRFNFNYWQPTK